MKPTDEVTREMVPEYLHPHLDVINRYHHYRGATDTHEFLDIDATTEDIRALLGLENALRRLEPQVSKWIRAQGGVGGTEASTRVYFAWGLGAIIADDHQLLRKHGLR